MLSKHAIVLVAMLFARRHKLRSPCDHPDYTTFGPVNFTSSDGRVVVNLETHQREC